MADPETQEKVTQLIQALVRKTRSKQLNWEDVSDPDDEMFRTVLSTVGGRGLIRIGRHTDSWKDEEHIPRENIAVTVWIFGSKGTEIAKVEYNLGQPSFSAVNELFDLAKINARHVNQELDWMLRELQK
jgi:hypothetical protein